VRKKVLRKDSSPDAAEMPERTPRAQWVYEALLEGVQGGKYQRGERIREEEVARSLGVSRTPVREALSRLLSRGLLEMSAGGLAVAELTRVQMMELYAMREILEGSAARFAAEQWSPGELATLRHLESLFERALGNPEKMAQVNRELHAAIMETAHNRYLMRTMNEVHDAMALLPGTTFVAPNRGEQAIKEHARIINAIAKRQPDEAEKLARDHIRKAQAVRLEMMFNYA
jgi:DNA-binding GntR family transcriptional regulator